MIQKRREAMGMTQRELAKKAKVTPGYIAQLEMGLRKNPSRASLLKLAKALEVPMDELMKEPQVSQREKLRRLKTAEVLREAALGGRTRAWFEGALPDYPDPHIADATKVLEEAGLVASTRDGRGYRTTESGRKYLEEHRLGEPDWIVRAPMIDFP